MARPTLPAERRRSVRVSVAVRTDVADAMFQYAQKRGTPLSAIISRILERIAERETALNAHQNTRTGWPIAR